MNWKKLLEISTIAIIVYLLSLVSKTFIPAFETLELKMLDWRFKFKGVRSVESSPIVLVTIDDYSSEALPERWPWPRSYYAHAIENLEKAGAKAIGLDLILDKPDPTRPEHDDILTNTLRASGKVVLARKLEQDTRLNTYFFLVDPVQEFKNATDSSLGLVSIESDGDGIYRRYPVAQEHNNNHLTSFALELIKKYKNYGESITVQKTQDGFIFGEFYIPNYDGSNMLINYAGPSGTFSHYSFASVLDDENINLGEEFDLNYFSEHILPGQVFRDKIVIIGSTVAEQHDNFPTPFLQYQATASETAGAEILANATDTILNNLYFQSPTLTFTLILTGSLIILILILSEFLPTLWATIATTAVVILYGIASFFLFSKLLFVTEIVFPVFAMFFAFIASNLYNYVQVEREKKIIMGAFQHYVPAKVVQELIENPEKLTLGGEERVMTVLFSDVANFTTISESLTPRELVMLINEYLSEMTDIILKYDGIIDKYEGDAIMAEFGAPIFYEEHALYACYAALEMQTRLKELSRGWRREGRPVLTCRTGINTGNMIVGNMGSNKVFDYTVLGDEVNLASRLEGANKPFGTKVMISETTLKMVENAVITRPLDLIVVKGKSKPVQVHELIGRRDEKLDNLMENVLPMYSTGMECYENRQWDRAASFFRQCLRLIPDDGPSKLYLRRAEEFVKNPPPVDWDGVYQLKSK